VYQVGINKGISHDQFEGIQDRHRNTIGCLPAKVRIH